MLPKIDAVYKVVGEGEREEGRSTKVAFLLCLRSKKAGRRRRGKKLGGRRGGGGEGERTTLTGYAFFIIIVIIIPKLTLTRLIAVVHDILSVSNFPHRDFEQSVCACGQ